MPKQTLKKLKAKNHITTQDMDQITTEQEITDERIIDDIKRKISKRH